MSEINPRLPVHDGRLFSWLGKTATAEVSTVALRGHAGRVWQDSCDVGFYVVSHKTGARKLFVETSARRDGSGDVMSWIYQSNDGITIELFND